MTRVLWLTVPSAARMVVLLVEWVDVGTGELTYHTVRLRVDGLTGLAREMLAGGIGEAV